MNILEQELEGLVWSALEEYDHDELQKRGLPVSHLYRYERQYDLGDYGRADIVGFYVAPSYAVNGKKVRNVSVQIIELKKEKVCASTFFQAVRYAKGIQERARAEGIQYSFVFDFFLIGKSVDTISDFVYMPDFFSSVRLFTYELSMRKGLVFSEQNNYSLTKAKFSQEKGSIGSIIKANHSEHFDYAREYMYAVNDWPSWTKKSSFIDDCEF